MLLLSNRAVKHLRLKGIVDVYQTKGRQDDIPTTGKVLLASRKKFRLWDEFGNDVDSIAVGIQYTAYQDGFELGSFCARMQYYEFSRFRLTARLRRRYIFWRTVRLFAQK